MLLILDYVPSHFMKYEKKKYVQVVEYKYLQKPLQSVSALRILFFWLNKLKYRYVFSFVV